MKNFILIGVGGYIAPRHLRAIKETGNNLLAAYDKNDSVGIMDSYFPKASFFTEQELFDRHNNRILSEGGKIDYLSVCSPNYLHDAHTRYGLRLGCDVICEKPVVLSPWNIDALEEIERASGHNAYTIFQLRLHPSVVALKKKISDGPKDKVYDVDLSYITPRGYWYYTSWKGQIQKSGGVATNIGVHFYDMLQWVFGPVQKNIVHVSSHDRVAGYLEMKQARVRYFLSINGDHLPNGHTGSYRSITVDGEEFEFSQGFTDLHTRSYEEVLAGRGFRIGEARECIKTVYDIRHAEPIGFKGDYHPMAKYPLTKHPFGW